MLNKQLNLNKKLDFEPSILRIIHHEEAIEQLKYIDNAPASPAERQQAGKIIWDSFE